MSVFIQTQIGPRAYKFERYSVTENPAHREGGAELYPGFH
jgi:hypothetical protein